MINPLYSWCHIRIVITNANKHEHSRVLDKSFSVVGEFARHKWWGTNCTALIKIQAAFFALIQWAQILFYFFVLLSFLFGVDVAVSMPDENNPLVYIIFIFSLFRFVSFHFTHIHLLAYDVCSINSGGWVYPIIVHCCSLAHLLVNWEFNHFNNF